MLFVTNQIKSDITENVSFLSTELKRIVTEQSGLQNKSKLQNMIVFCYISFSFFFQLYRIGLGIYSTMGYRFYIYHLLGCDDITLCFFQKEQISYPKSQNVKKTFNLC